MTRFKPVFRFALLLGGLMVAFQSTSTAQLPDCETYCACSRACYVEECQVNNIPSTCGDWGICEFSCYCGGEC